MRKINQNYWTIDVFPYGNIYECCISASIICIKWESYRAISYINPFILINWIQVPILIVGVLIIALLYLPSNWWGFPSEDYEGQLNTRLIVTILLVIYNISIYVFVGSIYRRAKKETTERIPRFGFSLLFYSMICMIIYLICIIIDTLIILFTDYPGYTIFMYIAWSFVIVFYILNYLSLIMPKWLEKRINK